MPDAVPSAQGGPDSPLAVDGLIGTKTVAAVKEFQASASQDGHVDPGQGTLRRFNAF